MRTGIALLIAVLPLVQGCTAAVVAGAAAGGIMVASDRRTIGTMTEDEGIELRTGGRIGERCREIGRASCRERV